MMQITVDVASLTQEQREHVSGFILTYPETKQSVTVSVKADVSEAKARLDEMMRELSELAPKMTLNPADDPSVGAEPIDPVAQAFGGTQVPLVTGASVAPFTAAVNQAPTVPVVTPVTSTVPSVPLPPVAPTENAGTTVAPIATNPAPVDKDGLPWDHRIHSSSEEKIQNGTWKKKRGVDPALVSSVETELRQLMGVPSAPVADWPFPVPNVAPAPAPAPAADPKKEWLDLIREATAAQHAGKIAPAEVSQCCGKHGVAALALLVNRLDLVAPIAADIRAIIASR